MARSSVLLCLILLVTLGVVISVTFADNIEVKSKDLESSKKDKKVDHDSKGGEKVDGASSDDEENEEKDKKKGHDVHKKDNQHENKDKDDEKKHVDKKKSVGHDKDDDDEKKHKDKKKDGHNDDDDDDTNDDTDDDDDDDDEDEVDGDDNEKENIGLYELKKGNLTIKFTNWGASIMSLHFPDKNG